MRRPTSLIAIALGAMLIAALGPPATGARLVADVDVEVEAAAEVDMSENVVPLKHFNYTGGSELAWSGSYMYAAQFDGRDDRGQTPDQGGVYIYKIRRNKRPRFNAPKQVGFFYCPGNDNDVSLVRPGLLAIAHHVARCDPAASGNGVTFVDVSDPRKPRYLSGVAVPSAHTLTTYPGGRYVYVSPGGLANGNGIQQIVDVKDPKSPEVVATFRPNPAGCHDLSFHEYEARTLAFCAGGGEIQVWDVSDPLVPVSIGHTSNPSIQFPHYALASPDGNLLVIDDEAFVAHECASENSPSGSLWFYDISIPEAPVLAGRFGPPRGKEDAGTYEGWTETWCASHHYNFVAGTRLLVTSWFTGGTNVLDLTDPFDPTELAYYQPDDAITWTAHWFRKRIYINDMHRGFEVIKVKGLKKLQKELRDK